MLPQRVRRTAKEGQVAAVQRVQDLDKRDDEAHNVERYDDVYHAEEYLDVRRRREGERIARTKNLQQLE